MQELKFVATPEEIQKRIDASQRKRADRLEQRQLDIDIKRLQHEEINEKMNTLRVLGYDVKIYHERLFELKKGSHFQMQIAPCGGTTFVYLEKNGWAKSFEAHCHPDEPRKPVIRYENFREPYIEWTRVKGDHFVRRIGVLVALRKAYDDVMGIK
jgi:hypothetical protein